jgi:hypothetical protein
MRRIIPSITAAAAAALGVAPPVASVTPVAAAPPRRPRRSPARPPLLAHVITPDGTLLGHPAGHAGRNSLLCPRQKSHVTHRPGPAGRGAS